MPSVPSVRRHYEKHFVHFLENRDLISQKLIVEYQQYHKVEIKLIVEYQQYHKVEIEEQEEAEEIQRRFDAIEEGAKIYDVFPLTGYNSEKGIGGSGHLSF